MDGCECARFHGRIGMHRFGMSRELVKGFMEMPGALRKSGYAYVTDIVEQVGNCEPRTFEEWYCENVGAFH